MRYGVCGYCQTSIELANTSRLMPIHYVCDKAEGMPRCEGSYTDPVVVYNLREGETLGTIEQNDDEDASMPTHHAYDTQLGI